MCRVKLWVPGFLNRTVTATVPNRREQVSRARDPDQAQPSLSEATRSSPLTRTTGNNPNRSPDRREIGRVNASTVGSNAISSSRGKRRWTHPRQKTHTAEREAESGQPSHEPKYQALQKELTGDLATGRPRGPCGPRPPVDASRTVLRNGLATFAHAGQQHDPDGAHLDRHDRAARPLVSTANRPSPRVGRGQPRRRGALSSRPEIAKHVAQGVPAAEARRRARQAFGQLDVVKDDCRQAWGLRLFDDLRGDLRFGVRRLARNPGFTGTAAFTLSIGIGGTAAMFSVTNAILFRPFPRAGARAARRGGPARRTRQLNAP